MTTKLLLNLLLLITAWPVFGDSSFAITHIATVVRDGEYKLSFQVDYTFNDTVLEALDNGVPLTIIMHIKVRHEGAWMWDDSLVDITKLYSIRYQPLTELYTVTHLPYGPKRNFATRDGALAALGEIDRLPLLKSRWLNPDKTYLIYLKVSLDLEALPLPLRPIAHLTPSWNLSSGWTQWQLYP